MAHYILLQGRQVILMGVNVGAISNEPIEMCDAGSRKSLRDRR